MAAATPYFITTAIDYVNAAPHLGHAYEKIATDVMARYQRLLGKPVFFLTGTDEHGIKIQKNARLQGIEPKAFADGISERFKSTWRVCQISYDRFIRTTEAQHYAVVQSLWKKLLAKGDLYKASYQGKYCSGCEAFLGERDLTADGLCAIHQTKPEVVEEENYFFRLSHYKERLIAHIEANPGFIQPDFRKQETLRMLEELNDISVSRSTRAVTWGIPVPDDADQVIYVWLDALSNYITGIGYDEDEDQFTRFWSGEEAGNSNAIHIIGKDILRFHAIYWPAFLMAADIPVPKTIFAHGFITLNEAKISKSLGNVIAPQDLISHYELPNSDAIRYYLMTVAPFGQDGNFSLDDFKLKVNADLANNLGNLLNRSLAMLKKYNQGTIPEVSNEQQHLFSNLLLSNEGLEELQQAYERFEFHKAAELLLSRVDRANQLIQQEEPWTLFKEAKTERLNALLYTVLESLRQVALLFSPIVPTLSMGIYSQLGLTWPEVPHLQTELLNKLPPNLETQPAGPLLPRLESELVGAAAKKGA